MTQKNRRLKTILGAFRQIVLSAIIVSIPYAYAAEDTGVAGVVDGDGLIMNGIEHRLFGIDAVELDQGCFDENNQLWTCGQRAARYLKQLVGSQKVTCNWTDTDRYRRRLSVCTANGVELNSELVTAGFAVAYTKYSSNYIEQNADAKANNRGIWRGQFLMPWDHRKKGEKLEIPPPYSDRKIKGNINRKGAKIYHCPSDHSYKNTKITEARGEKWFTTSKEAERNGWVRRAYFGECN